MSEARKLQKETLETGINDPEKIDAEETDADEFADSLAKDIDHIKALKIHEKKLVRQIKKIREAKKMLVRRVTKKV